MDREYKTVFSSDSGIKVVLMQHSPIELASCAIRKCTDSMDKVDSVGDLLGEDDERLIRDCIKKGHESVFEHIIYTFDIYNISRALLQEISRHRIASPSVQSTRWALKKILSKLKDGDDFDTVSMLFLKSINPEIDAKNREQVRFLLDNRNLPNDVLKYAVPEAFLTTEMLTINARSLWNMFNLRLNKPALKEFRDLTHLMLELVSDVHPVLFEKYNK